MSANNDLAKGFLEKGEGKAKIFWQIMGSSRWNQYLDSTWELSKLFHAMILTYQYKVHPELREKRKLGIKCGAKFGICVQGNSSSVRPLSKEEVKQVFFKGVHPSGKKPNPLEMLKQMKVQ